MLKKGTRIESTSDFKLDLHLPGRANFTEQSGGWNPVKGVLERKQEDAEIPIAAHAHTYWSACKESRRSCSGSVIMLMGAYVCGWIRKQTCVELVSAGAELIALTAGLSNGTYVRNLLCGAMKQQGV
eukprot:5363744-Amphidinium_carterae.2